MQFGCPPRYIAKVWQCHDGMQARAQNDGEYSKPFPVTNGVKQGCVMAPTLFSMMFSAMFTDAFQEIDLNMTFVDLTKAFDTVSRDGLWKIMAVWLSTQIHSKGVAVS